jgi:hypothetical protein
LGVRGLVAERSGRALPLTAEGTGAATAEVALAGALVAELAAGARGLLIAERPRRTGRVVATEGRGTATLALAAEAGGAAGATALTFPTEARRVAGTAALTFPTEARRVAGTAALALAAEARRTAGATLPLVAETLCAAGAAGPTLPLIAEPLRTLATGTTRPTGTALPLAAEPLRARATRTAGSALAFATEPLRAAGPTLLLLPTEATGTVRTPRTAGSTRTPSASGPTGTPRPPGPVGRLAAERGYRLGRAVHL